MKALLGSFNQEMAIVGALSVIVKTDCGTDGSFYSTSQYGVTLEPGDRCQFTVVLGARVGYSYGLLWLAAWLCKHTETCSRET